jgi:hypothetical protein
MTHSIRDSHSTDKEDCDAECLVQENEEDDHI